MRIRLVVGVVAASLSMACEESTVAPASAPQPREWAVWSGAEADRFMRSAAAQRAAEGDSSLLRVLRASDSLTAIPHVALANLEDEPAPEIDRDNSVTTITWNSAVNNIGVLANTLFRADQGGLETSYECQWRQYAGASPQSCAGNRRVFAVPGSRTTWTDLKGGLGLGPNPQTGQGCYEYSAQSVHTAHNSSGVSLAARHTSSAPGTPFGADCAAPNRPGDGGDQCEGDGGDEDQLRAGTDTSRGERAVSVAGTVHNLCNDPGSPGGGGSGGGGFWVTVTECWGYDVYHNGVYAYSVVQGCSSYSYYVDA